MHNDFFELYPLDGGGRFIMNEMLGTLSDAEITEKIMRGNALAEFGGIEKTDFLRFERWSAIEKSCWINRMYFIVPMARMYALSGDEKLARQIRELLLRFKNSYPPPKGREAVCELERHVVYERDFSYNSKDFSYDAPIEYQWFDFQPASRVLHILHAMYFLRDSKEISSRDWDELDELVFSHASTIWTAEKYFNPLEPGNHQALRGLALMLAAACFKGEPEAEKWREESERICHYHILNDFLEDGMLIDMSPSYHFFETWIFRDALALADRHGFRIAPEARERMGKAFEVCRMFAQPDGLSPVLNDGYPVSAEIFLKTLPSRDSGTKACAVLPKANIGFWNSAKVFAVLDSTPCLGEFSHFHAGKQAPTLFFSGKPFLADSGCCSYDDRDFSEWFKQSQAHSSLLVDGMGDSRIEGRYHWVKIPSAVLSGWEDGRINSVMTSPVREWEGIAWKRTLEIFQEGVTVEDEVISGGRSVEMEFIFNCHPDVTVEKNGREVLLTNGGVRVAVTFCAEPEIADGIFFNDFIKKPSKRLLLRLKGAGCLIATHFQVID